MTTNIDRAKTIVEDLIDEPWVYADGELASAVVGEFHAEGLLMPDLPEPYATGMTSGPRSIGDIDRPEEPFALFSVWNHPHGAAAYGDRVEITHTIVPDQRGYTPAQARDLAAALLAAANYAEEHPNDQ